MSTAKVKSVSSTALPVGAAKTATSVRAANVDTSSVRDLQRTNVLAATNAETRSPPSAQTDADDDAAYRAFIARCNKMVCMHVSDFGSFKMPSVLLAAAISETHKRDCRHNQEQQELQDIVAMYEHMQHKQQQPQSPTGQVKAPSGANTRPSSLDPNVASVTDTAPVENEQDVRAEQMITLSALQPLFSDLGCVSFEFHMHMGCVSVCMCAKQELEKLAMVLQLYEQMREAKAEAGPNAASKDLAPAPTRAPLQRRASTVGVLADKLRKSSALRKVAAALQYVLIPNQFEEIPKAKSKKRHADGYREDDEDGKAARVQAAPKRGVKTPATQNDDEADSDETSGSEDSASDDDDDEDISGDSASSSASGDSGSDHGVDLSRASGDDEDDADDESASEESSQSRSKSKSSRRRHRVQHQGRSAKSSHPGRPVTAAASGAADRKQDGNTADMDRKYGKYMSTDRS